MKYAFLFCLILALSACEPSNPNAPTRMDIHEIRVTKFPEFDGSDAWDDPLLGATTLPDPYLTIFAGDTVVTEFYSNQANEELTFTFPDPIRVYRTEDQQYLQLWDKDDLDWSDTNSPDDFMGGLTLIPWQIEGDETKTLIELNSSSIKMQVDVTFY